MFPINSLTMKTRVANAEMACTYEWNITHKGQGREQVNCQWSNEASLVQLISWMINNPTTKVCF